MHFLDTTGNPKLNSFCGNCIFVSKNHKKPLLRVKHIFSKKRKNIENVMLITHLREYYIQNEPQKQMIPRN
jgi:hypothetical protein